MAPPPLLLYLYVVQRLKGQTSPLPQLPTHIHRLRVPSNPIHTTTKHQLKHQLNLSQPTRHSPHEGEPGKASTQGCKPLGTAPVDAVRGAADTGAKPILATPLPPPGTSPTPKQPATPHHYKPCRDTNKSHIAEHLETKERKKSGRRGRKRTEKGRSHFRVSEDKPPPQHQVPPTPNCRNNGTLSRAPT